MPSQRTPAPEANPGLVLDDDELRVLLACRRRAADTLEEPKIAGFLGETLTLTASLVPSEAGSLLLDNPLEREQDGASLRFVAAFGEAATELVGTKVPVSAGIAGHVYRTGKLHLSNDAQRDPHFYGDRAFETNAFRSRSIVAAPLRFEKQVCGVFELVNRADGQEFSEHDAEIVSLVAGYISRALLGAIDVIKKNQLALFDDLTGLRNSRGMDRALETAISHARENNADVGALFIDLDHLKSINDSRGHRYGSAAIAKVGHVIRDVVSDRGLPFRFGGDEFVVIVPLSEQDEPDALEKLAERIVYHVRKNDGLIKGGGSLPPISVSVGAASMKRNLAATADQPTTEVATRLLAAADRALYRAKRSGRNSVALATRQDDTLRRPITGVTPREK